MTRAKRWNRVKQWRRERSRRQRADCVKSSGNDRRKSQSRYTQTKVGGYASIVNSTPPQEALNLLLGLLLLDLEDTLPLLGKPLGLPLAHGLVLDTTSLGLLLEVLGTELLGLGFVDVLHQDTLVLESVSLGLKVKSVVAGMSRVLAYVTCDKRNNSQVLVDLASLSVLLQQTPENSHAAEPLDFGRHTGLSGTPTLTGTGVSTETLGGVQLPGSGSGVNDSGLDDAVWRRGRNESVRIRGEC